MRRLANAGCAAGEPHCRRAFDGRLRRADQLLASERRIQWPGTTSGRPGCVFWITERPSTCGVPIAPPDISQSGMGVVAISFTIPLPLAAPR